MLSGNGIMRDMSDVAVKNRYERANELAITIHSAILFDSLADIPRLLDKITTLEQKLAELEIKVHNAT